MQRLRTDKRHVIDPTKSLLEAVCAVGDRARAVEFHLHARANLFRDQLRETAHGTTQQGIT
jgi:hypothetical protein